MEVAFLISLRHRIHSLKLNLNGRMAGSTRVCLMLLMLLSLVSKQWGLSTNDPGSGGGIFHYPVTFNPFIALAGTTTLGNNDTLAYDAVITKLEMTSCTIDSTPAGYKSNYRVIVIGWN